MTLHAIADEVHAEIHRAWVKFGPQYDVPDVDQVLMTREGGCTDLRMAQEYDIPTASRAKFITDTAFSRGRGTWAHILVEVSACPSRIAAACDCRTWCRDATALDRLDPVPATASWFPAYPEADS